MTELDHVVQALNPDGPPAADRQGGAAVDPSGAASSALRDRGARAKESERYPLRTLPGRA